MDLRDADDGPDDPKPVNDYTDWLNQRIADNLHFTGETYETTTEVQDHTIIQLCVYSHRTTPREIETMVEALWPQGK